ncbi:unnamed protein product [Caenorhabditis auriculariae]|uniref:TATA box-binding protein-associated factor RNA polymerase I subunit B n=1 Tax=Caenorhabditis auriculariae TaxID=2777116 RepID=A0A8S1GYN5_9PELO|nr:unnamed protein product [Caenorhabditis auriculariae]
MKKGSGEKKCVSCGSSSFNLLDGLLYCDVCGAHFEQFQELEHDENAQIIGRTKIRVKKNKDDVNRTKKKRVEKRKVDQFPNNFSTGPSCSYVPNLVEEPPWAKTPEYFYRMGVRIATFSSILMRCSLIMRRSMRLPEGYTKSCYSVFQRYLKCNDVAFTEKEVCEDTEEMFVAMVAIEEDKVEKRVSKKKKAEMKKKRGLEALSTSQAAWTFLTQGTLDENLAMSSDSEASVDGKEVTNNFINSSCIQTVETQISKDCVTNACRVHLDPEVLISILYLAALCCSCSNILLSDLVRWFREDRFKISRKELCLLKNFGYEKKTQMDPSSMQDLRFPLYEICRSVSCMSQSLVLDVYFTSPTFEKIAARIAYSLNLPEEMLQRVLYLHSTMPATLDVSANSWKRQATLSTKMNPFLASRKGFSKCFGRISGARNSSRISVDVTISPETKVISYFIMAIKLFCGLEENNDSGKEVFDFCDWLMQLKMRIGSSCGKDFREIFKKNAVNHELVAPKPFDDHISLRKQKGGFGLDERSRKCDFKRAIPQLFTPNSTYILPTVFLDAEKQNDDLDTDSLLAPLRHQASLLKIQLRESSRNFSEVDLPIADIFLKNFSRLTTSDVDGTFDEYFPMSKFYEKYPRPDYANGCVARFSYDNAKMENFNNRMDTKTLAGEYRMYLSLRLSEEVYGLASPHFSPTFNNLLRSFAAIIGEDEVVLYSSFLLLEQALLESGRIGMVKRMLLKGQPIQMEAKLFKERGKSRESKIIVTTSKSIDDIKELNLFRFGVPQWIAEEFEYGLLRKTRKDYPESDNDESDDLMTSSAEESEFNCNDPSREKPKQSTVRHGLGFNTVWSIFALKYW